MKEYLLNLLNEVILSRDSKNDDINYDIAFLEDMIKRINGSEEYFYSFILDLNDDVLKDLVNQLEQEEAQKSFLASIMYLKNLTKINKEQGIKIPLSKEQNEILFKLYELIKRVIKNEKAKKAEASNYEIKEKEYTNLQKKLKDSIVLDINDYNLIDALIHDNVKGNTSNPFNDVMTFLNSYNYDLLTNTDDVNAAKVINKTDKNEEKVEKENVKVNLNTSQNHKKQFEDLKEDKVKVNPVEIDIFNPQSFDIDYEKETVSKKKKTKANIIFDPYDALIDFGIEKEKLNAYSIKLLDKVKDEKSFTKTAQYIKENLFKYFDNENINGLISLLCLSDVTSLKNIFKIFNERKLSEPTIKDLVNRCTEIFFTSNKDNFKNNLELVFAYNADLDTLLRRNITFFYNTFDYNKNKINILERNGLNINQILNTKPQLLAINTQQLIRNLNVLKNYNYDLEEIDYDSLSIIGTNDLADMIDTFIEAGFSEILFSRDSLKNTRASIIKRIYYSFKNELNIWKENITDDRLIDTYEEWISKEKNILSEEEIRYLVSDYEILDFVETGKRPVIFKNQVVAQIKRKYEFKFNNIIISRLKTYSVFKVLVSHNVNEKDALFYALTYHSNLEYDDYLMIRKIILGK